MQVDRPNWNDGFADFSLKDLSDAPGQWLGGVASYAPFLGVQGNTLYDLDGYGNHGALTGVTPSVAWATGYRGTALSFDGVAAQVLVPHGPSIQLSGGNFTIMAWIYPRSFGSYACLLEKQSGGIREYAVFFETAVRMYCEVGGSIVVFNLSPGFTTNTWQHVVAVRRDMGTFALYRNGVEVGSTAATGTNVGVGALSIGYDSSGGGVPWDGYIDDLRFYSRALRAAEILSVYADPFARYRLRRRMWAMSFDVIDVSQFRRRPPR